MLSYYLSNCYAAHPDLHSFPTRRSSDLSGLRRSLVAKPPASPESLLDRFGPHPAYTPPGGWQDESRNPAERLVKTHRSEEHTSELQSLRHLVCRLLLEKKKKTRSTRWYS